MKKRKPLTNKAGEVRALKKEDFAAAKPLKQAFPQLALYSRKRAAMGEQHKQSVNIRMSPEVVAWFKAKGTGWQTRIDNTLKSIIDIAR